MLYKHKSKVVTAPEDFHLKSFRWEMREETSTSRIKEYYNNSLVQDFGEEEVERGHAKGSKEGISLGQRKGGLVRRTFPGGTSRRGKDTLKLG